MSLADPAAPRGAGPLVRWLLAGHACAAVGLGLTGPYLFVYLRQTRALGAGASCLLLAWAGLAWCVASHQGRRLATRHGPRPLVLTALATQAGALVYLLTASAQGPTLAALTLLGAGGGLLVAPLEALFGQVVPVAGRSRVNALRALLARAGRCAGGLVSVLLLGLADIPDYRRVFLLAVVAQLAFALILMRMPGVGRVALRGPRADWQRDAGGRRASGALLDVVAFGQRLTGFPAYATMVVQVAPAVLGFSFAAYEAVGLAVDITARPGGSGAPAGPQVGVARAVAGTALLSRSPVALGRDRTRALVAATAAGCWLLLGLAGIVAGAAAAPLVVSALAALGLAATIRRRAETERTEPPPLGGSVGGPLGSSRWFGPTSTSVGAALLAAALFGVGWPRLWLVVVGVGSLVAVARLGERGEAGVVSEAEAVS